MVDTYGSGLGRHRPRRHTFGFQSITFEGMHQFIQSLQNGKA